MKTPVCPECDGEEFLHVRSEVLPQAPITLIQCEECGAQFSTGVLPELGLPVLAGVKMSHHLKDIEVEGRRARWLCECGERGPWMYEQRGIGPKSRSLDAHVWHGAAMIVQSAKGEK